MPVQAGENCRCRWQVAGGGGTVTARHTWASGGVQRVGKWRREKGFSGGGPHTWIHQRAHLLQHTHVCCARAAWVQVLHLGPEHFATPVAAAALPVLRLVHTAGHQLPAQGGEDTQKKLKILLKFKVASGPLCVISGRRNQRPNILKEGSSHHPSVTWGGGGGSACTKPWYGREGIQSVAGGVETSQLPLQSALCRDTRGRSVSRCTGYGIRKLVAQMHDNPLNAVSITPP